MPVSVCALVELSAVAGAGESMPLCTVRDTACRTATCRCGSPRRRESARPRLGGCARCWTVVSGRACGRCACSIPALCSLAGLATTSGGEGWPALTVMDDLSERCACLISFRAPPACRVPTGTARARRRRPASHTSSSTPPSCLQTLETNSQPTFLQIPLFPPTSRPSRPRRHV